MRLAAGIISSQDFVLTATQTPLVHFRLSTDRLSQVALLDGASCTPGRYVGEILRRLQAAYPGASAYLVCNPLFQFPSSLVEQLTLLAERIDTRLGASWILSDEKTQHPLAYLFTAETALDCPIVHLSLLNTLDAQTEQAFLLNSFGHCDVLPVRSYHSPLPHQPGYYTLPSHPAYRAAQQHATHLMMGAQSPQIRKNWLQNSQRVAILSWHAGDVLFLLEALALEKTEFSAVMVLPDYVDIVRYLRPDLECLPLDAPTPHRNSYMVADEIALQWEHVERVLATGTHGHRFFHLLRPGTRNYNATHHHLREVCAFAVGGPGHSLRRLPVLSQTAHEEFSTYRPHTNRVLLQFESGWSLKNYPLSWRSDLLDLLQASGFQPILLGSKEHSHPHIPHLAYGSLAEFRALLGTAVALIGCDSFPTHFANQVSRPAITLFGSTRPANSRPSETALARYLHHPLPCVPCCQSTECRTFSAQHCLAHARPSEVVDNLRALVGPPHAQPELSLADCHAAWTANGQRVVFPSGQPATATARERFIDQLFASVQFESLSTCPHCHSSDIAKVGDSFRLPVFACNTCQLWFVQRRISEGDLPVLYSEQYWLAFMALHQYPTFAERYYYDYVAALERVLAISQTVRPGAAVLDIGCGAAAFPRRLKEAGYDAAGLELDAKLAKRASLLAGAPVYSSLEDLQSTGKRFDLITGFDVFEHIYRPKAYLRSLVGIATPHAHVLFETFRTDSLAFQQEGISHEDVKPIEHPYMYRQSHLVAILEESGFDVVNITYPQGPEHARVRVLARLK